MKTLFNIPVVTMTALLLGACGGGDSSSPIPAADVVQLDRMGRPAIATALISLGTTNELNDQYNEEADPSQWERRFRAEIQANLEALDAAFDAPGNALLGDSSLLAGILVDDRLQIDTSQSNCVAYLAVELGLSGDCGGRTLIRDVIDDSLEALTGIDDLNDGVEPDENAARLFANFPFLGVPN